MYKWILPSLSEILAANQIPMAPACSAKAESQWRYCVAATEKLLLNTLDNSIDNNTQGLVLAAPAPLFCCDTLTQNIQTITFTAKPFNPRALMPFEMPTVEAVELTHPTEPVLPLLVQDPLGAEQFCLVFTSAFQLVLVLGEDENGNRLFSFSFDPETVQQAWKVLGARIMMVNPDCFANLANLVQNYGIVAPDFRIMTQFSQLLLAEFSEDQNVKSEKSDKEDLQVIDTSASVSHHIPLTSGTSYRSDVELLQAFAHEVRTPLATIRTMTRLLLKYKDLPANVIKRLKMIDDECTEQIDRMEFLFRAVELETSNLATGTHLTPMCLEQVLQESIPRWQQAASRRNLKLNVVLPQKLPTVVSNPNMLDRVLTNLIENFARNLPSGSQLQVQFITAGNQLKLQLLPLLQDDDTNANLNNIECTPPIRKAIGQLLMFQPETGTISLNLAATKHLFQAIGGKLIVRQRPKHGEVMTIFLPLEAVDDSKLLNC